MDTNRLPQLVEKYIEGTATPQEIAELHQWYRETNEQELEWPEEKEAVRLRMLARIEEQTGHVTHRIRLWPRIAAAASILLALSAGGYFLWPKKAARQIAQNQRQDISPGSNKAILKLANGKTISITDAKNGLITQSSHTTITKLADGQLAYQNTTGTKSGTTLYDTLIVPRGGQHQVKFADGSIAYLDADSKLRIPENFNGSNRTVELISGRADFRVVHNASQPFKVSVRGQVTTDIGTEFNISAYPDEPVIKTTLLEGSVQISTLNQNAILKPGQQAQSSEQEIKVINDADVEAAIAWHKGLFEFHDASIKTVMQELSRWYDVDVSYEGQIPDRTFSGKMYRNVSALKIADILNYKHIHFRIAGKKIIVMP